MNYIEFLKITKGKKVVIVCECENAHAIYYALENNNTKINCFADNSGKKIGTRFEQIRILSVDQAAAEFRDDLFLISVEKYGIAISEQLIKMGVPLERIIVVDFMTIIELKHCRPDIWLCEDDMFIYHNPVRRNKCHMYEIESAKIENVESRVKDKKYFVSICGIFKNEAPYLKEWIQYHLDIGIDHVYLYNNNSDDNYWDVISGFVDAGKVTFKEWPYFQAQLEAYMDCVKLFANETQWLGFIDIDEFLHPIKNKSIIPFFERIDGASSVQIPWLVMGSSGIKKRDINEPVLETFVHSWRKHSDVGKSFLNTDFQIDVEKEPIFHHLTYTVKDGKEYNPINVFGDIYRKNVIVCGELEFPIEIRHYAVKSVEEYERKQFGTDVFYSKNPHTDNAFLFHDGRCTVYDDTMKNLIGNKVKK